MHFLCVGTPQRKGEYAADLRYVDAVVDGLAPHLTRPPWSSASPPCRSARPPGCSAASPSWPRPGRPPSWPGTRSSCARASRSRTRCAPTGWSSGTSSERAEQLLREVYASAIAQGHAVPGHRLRHRRAGEGRRQRLPGHQDLVHQRDGRGLRGDRRRRHPAGRRARATTSASAASSSTPASASAAAACPRTSARSWPGPASSASTRR